MVGSLWGGVGRVRRSAGGESLYVARRRLCIGIDNVSSSADEGD